MKKYFKSKALITLILVGGLFVATYLVKTKTSFFQRASTPSYSQITNDTELIKAQSDLENINLDQIDAELNKNDQELSDF